MFSVIVREGGRSSIPETPLIETIGRGVLDAPPSRSMTNLCGGGSGLLRFARNDRL